MLVFFREAYLLKHQIKRYAGSYWVFQPEHWTQHGPQGAGPPPSAGLALAQEGAALTAEAERLSPVALLTSSEPGHCLPLPFRPLQCGLLAIFLFRTWFNAEFLSKIKEPPGRGRGGEREGAAG